MTIPKPSSRRKELISIAASLFKKNSFDRTSVRMLAAACHLKSGSLFHHFKDKQEILMAVIEDGLSTSLLQIKQHTQHIENTQEQLLALITCHLNNIHGDKKDAHIVSITEWKFLSDPAKKHLINCRDEYEQYWQHVINRAVNEQLLQGDPNLIRLFIIGSLNWTIQWFQPSRGLNIDNLAKQFYQTLLQQPL